MQVKDHLPIDTAIKRSSLNQSDCARKSLLYVAENNIAITLMDAASLGLAIHDCKERGLAS